jgi:large subunit ribosomal protein L32e
MVNEKLVKVRNESKAKKPVFLVQDANKRREITGGRWRRPKGLHSKMRLHKSGNPKQPSQGYRSPVEVRFAHPSGLRPVVVCNEAQLNAISKDEGVVFSSTLGMRKKLALATIADKKKLVVLNLDIPVFLQKAADVMKARKEKATKKIEVPEKKPEPSKDNPQISEEEKKKEEKKEKDKVITQRS